MKKLFFLLFFVQLAYFVSAAPWTGNVANNYGGGTGTASDPYLINTPEQLAFLAQQTNTASSNTAGMYFKQTADLDLGELPWTTIGNVNNKFSGNYDGDNHTISNIFLASQTDEFYGLFGYISGTSTEQCAIKNVIMLSGVIGGGSNVGGIAGRADHVSFYNCSNAIDIAGKQVGTTSVGGIAGRIAGVSTMDYCSNTGNISATGEHAGGLAGQFAAPVTGTYVRFCSNSGQVRSLVRYAGGLFGSVSGTLTIDQSFNEGLVFGNQGSVGGIVGYAGSHLETHLIVIDNCYNTGEIMGLGTNIHTPYAGGIIGSVSNGTTPKWFKSISNSYNAGIFSIQAGSREAIVGQKFEMTNFNIVTNSYCADYGTTPPVTNLNGGIMKNYNDMVASQAFVTTLNNEQTPAVWALDLTINGGLPILAWQLKPVPNAINKLELINSGIVKVIGNSIYVHNDDDIESTVTVFNLNGTRVHEQKLVNTEFSVNVPSGIYIVNIKNGQASNACKVVVF